MKTRKLVALVAAIVMTLSILPIVGASAEAPKSSSLWFENGLTIKWMTRETSQQKMDIDAPVLKAIKEATNATIELQPIPEADYDTKRKTTLASNTMPDVMAHLTTDEISLRPRARSGWKQSSTPPTIAFANPSEAGTLI